MTIDSTSLGKLASSSMRLNRGVLILVGVAVVLVGTCAWALQRLLEVETLKAESHFARLVESLNENRLFLTSVNRAVKDAKNVTEKNLTPLQSALVFHSTGMNIFESKEFSFSTPFNVAQSDQLTRPDVGKSAFSLGMHLANFYSGFWSGSVYPSPQLFLLPPNNEFTLAVPAIGARRGHVAILNLESFLQTSEELSTLLKQHDASWQEGQVYWTSTKDVSAGNPRVFALIKTNLPDNFLDIEGDNHEVLLAALINVRRFTETPLGLDTPVFDDITLVAPSGAVLLGHLDGSLGADGMRLTSSGLEIKVSSSQGERWSAIYRIGYDSFLHYAKWQLLSFFGIAVLCVYLGWLVSRWYRMRVVFPAERAHRRVIESEVFSRAVIDTAPTGLCVVRQSDNQMLLSNKRAQAWLGNSQYISRLIREQHADMGEACVEVGGRYLHVSFSSTRYQEQDVIVCAFSDVTGHRDDAAALTRAKHQAEEASHAKTTFLATMSHEIRTPLYGVLGTLELLELTTLDNRQRVYLNTIARSSSTLLQLISDVLDVSKIESGQMALEPGRFCPLDMVEEVVDAYAAAAENKGLQIYACIDADVPDQLDGDQSRIRQILNNLLNNAIKFTDFGRVVLRLKVLQQDTGCVTLQWQVTDTGLGISQSQQQRLFEPFYQVFSGHCAGGTGLGLSICNRLSQLMDGQLRVVSEPGLGSSFSLILSMPILEGVLPGVNDLQLRTTPVYVRAPVNELAETTCAWLNRWGAHALVAPQGVINTSAGTVMVDLLPGRNGPLEWSGARVMGVPGAGQPEYTADGWQVGLHMIRGIGRAVMLAQQGRVSHAIGHAPTEREKLALRVLVAEDNPINQAILKEQLEALGCRVVLASHGQEALSLWSPDAFDAVLTDVNMPIMNGYELASAIRQQDMHIPIIGVTANAMREEAERCSAVGMNARMVKPMTLQTLWRELVKACEITLSDALFTDAHSPASSAVMPAAVDESIVVSARMRDLFISTMVADIETAYQALVSRDSDALKARLHCIRGALAVVQAHDLAQHCGDLEHRLEGHVLDASVQHQLEALLARIKCAVAAV